ncbi:hypothetical protein EN859_022790 [Mesorhizobium sp. M00.F.Ca.ET.216.01.1.1]|nr:hypothetical protein EN859_022790 [Mesorhizobium sp. M00.F.Ca.ET.216.01.1.1]TJW06997.1 MAG: hypothetical protein E5W82_25145 [Mesorhizobium sp.]
MGQQEAATMHGIITSTALALAVALTSVPLGVASAQDLELHLGDGGPKLRLRENCDPDREDCRDRRDYRRECSPERALDKAERMGVRRARIDGIGRRTIDVRGRDLDGDRIVITFDRRDRRCPVLSSD